MFLRLPPFARIPLTIALVCVLGLSLFIVKNTIVGEWQSMHRQWALYDRSPNCSQTQDPAQVDSHLSPCSKVSLVVIAKPTKTPAPFSSFSDHSQQHLYLTLRNPTGHTQTYGPVDLDMWASLHIGDQVQATYWRNEVQDFRANGFSYLNTDSLHEDKWAAIVMFWCFVAISCSFTLQELWFPRRKAAPSWLWFNIIHSKDKSRW